jgi:hypothetical protein
MDPGRKPLMTAKAKKGPSPAAARGAAVRPSRLDDRGWDRIAPLAFAALLVVLFGSFLFSGKMLFGTDTLPTGYAARKAFADLARSTRSIPLWNPYVMGGIPTVDGLIGGEMFYPTTLLQFLFPVHRALGLKLVLHVFLAGWFFYFFARERGASRGASLFGGVSYMFAPYLVSLIYAGHDGKLFVASLLPLGFLALERLMRHARFQDFLLFALAVGLLILTAHLQLAFFACGAFGFRFIWESVGAWRRGEKARVRRAAALFAGAACLGAALGAVQTIPAYMYTSRFSPRAGGVTYAFATSWSIHWEEAVSLVVPEFGHYLDDYWGKNPFKLNCESPGFLAMLLVTAGFFRLRRDRELLHWYVLLLVTFVYAMGAETPAFRVIYHLVPKFFRAPSTILFLFSFGASWIGVRVLDAYWADIDRRRILAGFALCGALLFLLLVGIAGGEGFFRAWSSLFWKGMPAERMATALRNAPRAQTGILLSLLLGGLFVGITEMGRRRRWRTEILAGAAVLLAFLGSYRTDRDFVKSVRLEDYVRSDALIRKMAEDREVFRALSTIPNIQDNYFSIFGIEGARGFFDNRIRWYDEVASPENIRNANILNLLNVKYVVSGTGLRHPSFVEEATESGRSLYRNRDVLPRAFLAESYEIADRSSMIPRLKSPDFDPRRTLLLEEDPGFPPAGDDSTDGVLPVTWLTYSPNKLRVGVSAEKPSLLFLANPYLPYWRARVDGRPARVLRAHYAFQSVPVPQGEHEVTLEYRSAPVLASGAISLGAALFLAVGAARVFVRRKGGVSVA